MAHKCWPLINVVTYIMVLVHCYSIWVTHYYVYEMQVRLPLILS